MPSSARRRRDRAEDRAARLVDALHALVDLHLRHRQILRRYGDPPAPGWSDGVNQAMGELQAFLEAELDEAREQWTQADDECAGGETVMIGPQGRIRQLRLGS